MTRIAAVLDRRAPNPELRWFAYGVGVALLVGAALALNTAIGLGFALLVGVTIAVILRPANILAVLVGAVFLELIKIGGVTVTRLIAPVALLVVLIAVMRKETAIRWSAPLAWAFAYALWALASGLWTQSYAGTVVGLSSLAIALVYMLTFGALISTKGELNRVLYIFAAFSLVLGMVSILAFTGRHPFGLSLGIEGRAGGGTGNPNYFAALQVIALPMILVLAANEQRRRRLGFLLVCALVNIGSILSTVSRGGTLSLMLVVVLLLLLPATTVFRSRAQKALTVGFILLGGALFFYRYSSDLGTRLLSTFGGSQSTDAGSGRLGIWPAAWDAFTEHPFTGIGYGAFLNQSVERILDTPISQDFELFHTEPKEVHNAYLGSLAEVGLPGLVLFLGLLLSTAFALRRTAIRARERDELYIANVANGLIIGLAGWAVGSLFAESETARPRWIVVGICLALPKLLAEKNGRESSANGDSEAPTEGSGARAPPARR